MSGEGTASDQDEIEVTPEMARAGMNAFLGEDIRLEWSDTKDIMAAFALVFREMAKLSPSQRLQSSSASPQQSTSLLSPYTMKRATVRVADFLMMKISYDGADDMDGCRTLARQVVAIVQQEVLPKHNKHEDKQRG